MHLYCKKMCSIMTHSTKDCHKRQRFYRLYLGSLYTYGGEQVGAEWKPQKSDNKSQWNGCYYYK